MKKIPRIIGVTLVIALTLLLAVTVQAQVHPTLDRARSSTLVGNSAGAFDKYIFKHPGDGQSINLQMTYRPVHPNAEKGIGFKVYGEGGKLVGEARKVPGTGGMMELALTANTPTQYLVQVQNYYPGFQITYTLDPVGLSAGARPAPKPEPETGTAQNPSWLVNIAQGQLSGNRAGSFDFYQVQADAGDSVWVKMTFQPTNSVIARGVGFNVYRGANLVGQGHTLPEDRSALWTNLLPSEESTFLVQVYNYIPNVSVNYDLEITTVPAND